VWTPSRGDVGWLVATWAAGAARRAPSGGSSGPVRAWVSSIPVRRPSQDAGPQRQTQTSACASCTQKAVSVQTRYGCNLRAQVGRVYCEHSSAWWSVQQSRQSLAVGVSSRGCVSNRFTASLGVSACTHVCAVLEDMVRQCRGHCKHCDSRFATALAASIDGLDKAHLWVLQ
jgi:hypothetical protein